MSALIIRANGAHEVLQGPITLQRIEQALGGWVVDGVTDLGYHVWGADIDVLDGNIPADPVKYQPNIHVSRLFRLVMWGDVVVTGSPIANSRSNRLAAVDENHLALFISHLPKEHA